MAWGPAIDESPVGLLDFPLNLMQKGQFNRVRISSLLKEKEIEHYLLLMLLLVLQVPFMLGTNANEGSIFVPMFLLIVKGITPPFSDKDLAIIIEHCLVCACAAVSFACAAFFIYLK